MAVPKPPVETTELTGLRDAVSTLVGVDWADSVSGEGLGDIVVELGSLKARLAAVELAVTAGFDRSGHWQSSGARNAGAWIRTQSRCRDYRAKKQVRLSRKAPQMAATWQALSSGTITTDHLDLLAKANSEGREALFERDEALLVRQGCELSYKAFSKTVAYWIEAANDAIGKDPTDKTEGRRLHCTQTIDGLWYLDGQLSPLEGVEFTNELKRLYDIEYTADWAAATERLGRTPTVEELDRTPAQRRADALIEMARRSATTTAPGEAAPRLINLRMDYPTFIAETAAMTGSARQVDYPPNRCSETAAGAVIAPSTALNPDVATLIRRIVFDTGGQVLEYGQSARLFKGALKDAIAERDQECVHPYCETDAAYCQTDHITEHEDHGPTNINNAALLCGPHNRHKHQHKRKHHTA